MPDRTDWVKCKSMTRAELRANGGCLWPVQPNSPGNKIAIPNGTDFQIRYEGPESHVYVSGKCEGFVFHVTGNKAYGSYPSASAAVNAVRAQVEQSNAYLYIEFKVADKWYLANDLRYDNELSTPVDNIEEKILSDLRDKVREKYNKEVTKLSPEEIEEKAEIAYDKNPEFVKKMREAYSGIYD